MKAIQAGKYNFVRAENVETGNWKNSRKRASEFDNFGGQAT